MPASTRIAMMLPGAVSLGAYEGGALAGLLVAVQAAEGQLVVDAIASASAGSITALIAARALLCGADPVALMTATWVDLPSLTNLKQHDPVSPLSMQQPAQSATELLGTATVPDGPSRQQVPVHLSMALTALGGLNYHLPRICDPRTGGPGSLVAQTYVDWFSTTLQPGATEQDFLAAVDGALASGSTPVGFPPRLIDRSEDPTAMAAYRDEGIINPTGDWHVWYSDGGDIDNEPFGRVLDLIGVADSPDPTDDRVIVLLQTEARAPDWGGRWFDPNPADVPSWIATLLQVGHIQKSHNYFDDLRRLEKTNTQLKWVKEVAHRLDGALRDATSGLSETDAAAVNRAIDTALAGTAESIDADRGTLRTAASRPVDASTTTATLNDVLLRAAGLDGKRPALVELISPAIDPSDGDPPAPAAGAFLFHFGGFLDRRFRQSDFARGYRNARFWLQGWLPAHVTDPAPILAAVEERYAALGWDGIREDHTSIRSLSVKEDAELVELAAHIADVTERGLVGEVRRKV